MVFGMFCCNIQTSKDDGEGVAEIVTSSSPKKVAQSQVPGPEVDDWFSRQTSNYTHGVRTTADEFVPAQKALAKLKTGNERFVEGKINSKMPNPVREKLAVHGQNPMAAVIGCADSRCPSELIFDVQPGDIFVLRNAGNTLTDAEASFIGSAEYCCGPLGTNLLVVLGHTKCGAIAGATKMMLAAQAAEATKRSQSKTTLERLLTDLRPVTELAQKELGKDAKEEDIAKHAVKVNVFYTIDKLLTHSVPLRDKVKLGKLEVHGAIFDINTGKVDFLGQHPNLSKIVAAK